MSLSMGYAQCCQRRKVTLKRQEDAGPSEARPQILNIIILDLGCVWIELIVAEN